MVIDRPIANRKGFRERHMSRADDKKSCYLLSMFFNETWAGFD